MQPFQCNSFSQLKAKEGQGFEAKLGKKGLGVCGHDLYVEPVDWHQGV